MSNVTYPTEVIDLPSKGWFYPEGHPLASGKLEVFYMTAKHEDILTSRNLISKGVVIDKLMEALIADKRVSYNDLLLGDKNGLMVAARIMGYGKNYEVGVECPACEVETSITINLEDIDDKVVTFDPAKKGTNEFTFQLPHSKKVIKFKLLNHADEREIQIQLDSLKKLKTESTTEVTTRMKQCILSVDGNADRKFVGESVDAMPARDAAAFREHVKTINPDIDLSFNFECPNCQHIDRLGVPIDVNFFWPNSSV